MLLFSFNTNRLLYTILGRLGITISHRTTLTRLHTLAADATGTIQQSGAQTLEGVEPRYFAILYDNINQRIKAWRPRVGAKDTVESGTASTLVMLEDVPPGAFDPAGFKRRCEAGSRRTLTPRKLRALLQHSDEQLSSITMASVLRILVTHIPPLNPTLPSSTISSLNGTPSRGYLQDARPKSIPSRRPTSTKLSPLGTKPFSRKLFWTR